VTNGKLKTALEDPGLVRFGTELLDQDPRVCCPSKCRINGSVEAFLGKLDSTPKSERWQSPVECT
jgi:hypothetical protein